MVVELRVRSNKDKKYSTLFIRSFIQFRNNYNSSIQIPVKFLLKSFQNSSVGGKPNTPTIKTQVQPDGLGLEEKGGEAGWHTIPADSSSSSDHSPSSMDDDPVVVDGGVDKGRAGGARPHPSVPPEIGGGGPPKPIDEVATEMDGCVGVWWEAGLVLLFTGAGGPSPFDLMAGPFVEGGASPAVGLGMGVPLAVGWR